MKKITNSYLFYGIVAAIVLLLMSPFTRMNRTHSIWFIYLALFITISLCIKFKPEISKKIFLGMLSTTVLLCFADYIIDFSFKDFGIYELLLVVSYTLALIVGYFFSRATTRNVKILWISISVIYCTIAVLFVAEKFLHYEQFGNFTGRTEQQAPKNIHFINEARDKVNANQGSDKLIILDFWTTTCGYCFKQFPLLESLNSKYKNDSRVSFVAVNVPSVRDKDDSAIDMIRSRHFSFPVGFAIDSMNEKLNVYKYPVVIGIRNNKIVFRGDLVHVDEFIKEQLSTN